MPSLLHLLLLALFTLFPLSTWAQRRAVIDDPDGYTNLRRQPNSQSPILTRVVRDEPFQIISEHDTFATWIKVQLPSGRIGYLHASRVRFQPLASDLTPSDPQDEATEAGRALGFDYYSLARRAARGEARALARFLTFSPDGAAAEVHQDVLGKVLHLCGDAPFAAALSRQSRGQQFALAEVLLEGNVFYPLEPRAYLRRVFPQSAQLLNLKSK